MPPTPLDKQPRVVALDILRALVLGGILLVHTCWLFAFNLDSLVPSSLTEPLREVINLLLTNKCGKLFALLFGISFYFISSGKHYSRLGFALRCLILFLFGLLNKMFYSYEILMSYAFWGLCLIPLKNVSVRHLLFLSLSLYTLSLILQPLYLGDRLFPQLGIYRYAAENSLWQIIQLTPYSLLDAWKILLNTNLFITPALFITGFALAKGGLNSFFHFAVSFVLPSFCIALFSNILYFTYLHESRVDFAAQSINNMLSSFCYLCLFVRFYKHCSHHKYLHYLASYGRMGLSNYTSQNIFGVLFFYYFEGTMLTALLCMMAFYILQLCFSYRYLQRFPYGPMEGLWRYLVAVFLPKKVQSP